MQVKRLKKVFSPVKKILWHRRFPVNFQKFLRTPFFAEHLRWLLLPRQTFPFKVKCIGFNLSKTNWQCFKAHPFLICVFFFKIFVGGIKVLLCKVLLYCTIVTLTDPLDWIKRMKTLQTGLCISCSDKS